VSDDGLAARLRAATQPMHSAAQGTRFIRALFRGRIERREYCLLLRNLHALYDALERGLVRNADTPALAPLPVPALLRAASLNSDLSHLHGTGWRELQLTAAMSDYVARIEQVSAGQPPLLAAHAYVRYMGDLSGGQLLGGIVGAALRLEGGRGTAFYRFDGDPTSLKAQFRTALDGLPVDAGTANAIVTEAIDAFARHVRLFRELGRAPPDAGAGAAG
jgi:heme oxygenase (biliverdin-producing, ferredoxin)